VAAANFADSSYHKIIQKVFPISACHYYSIREIMGVIFFKN
jgi:hypothetical protein